MDKKYKNLKYGCYMMSMSMSVVANLSPVLFITFRELYGITVEQLGMKFGMLTGMLFPLIAIFVYLALFKTRKGKKTEKCQLNTGQKQ